MLIWYFITADRLGDQVFFQQGAAACFLSSVRQVKNFLSIIVCYDALFARCFALLLILFYLTPSVAAKLKGLFVLFAGYLVKNCASLLDASNISKTGKLIRNVELDRLTL